MAVLKFSEFQENGKEGTQLVVVVVGKWKKKGGRGGLNGLG